MAMYQNLPASEGSSKADHIGAHFGVGCITVWIPALPQLIKGPWTDFLASPHLHCLVYKMEVLLPISWG